MHFIADRVGWILSVFHKVEEVSGIRELLGAEEFVR